MIQLIQQLDTTVYAPIIYIVGESDVTSIPRLQRYISSLKKEDGMNSSSQYNCRRSWEGRYPKDINDDKNTTTTTPDDPTITASAHVYTLPRAREVHQSYLSSIFTTLYSTYKTLQLLYTIRPNLIITNGPGTCVPLVYCAFVLRLWFSLMNDDSTKQSTRSSNNNNNKRSSSHHLLYRTIFIESICRVKTLSLSGKLVYPIVDSFMVHWPNLMERYGMVENCDVFVSSLTTTSDEDDG
jgi:beta-1,4-N-acetylglucosaminyltransferase